jgi:hypothetical protein
LQLIFYFNSINEGSFDDLIFIKLEANIGNQQNQYLLIKNNTPIKTTIHVSTKPFELNEKYAKQNTKCCSFVNLEKQDFILNGYEIISISFSILNTMWGTYNHTFEIKINGIHTTRTIPIQINTIGLPVKIYSSKCLNNNEESSMIRYYYYCFMNFFFKHAEFIYLDSDLKYKELVH